MMLEDAKSEGRGQVSTPLAGQENLLCAGKKSKRIRIKHCGAERSTRAYMLSMPKDGIFQVLYVLERCPKCKSQVLQLSTFYPDRTQSTPKLIPQAMHGQFMKQALSPDPVLAGVIAEIHNTLEGVKVQITGEWTRKVKRPAELSIGYV